MSSPLSSAHTVAKLPAQDLERARTFYREKLGLEPVEERVGGLRYVCGPTEFHLFSSAGAPSGASTQMAFEVEDLESTLADLRARGLTFERYEMPGFGVEGDTITAPDNYPSKGTGERGTFFYDSEGNLIGIGQAIQGEVAPSRRVRAPDGTSIALWRSGEGRPLVALHGVTIDHTNWDALRAALEANGTLIAVDRRGHGSSESGPLQHSLEQEVADLAAVIESCDEPVDVLAHSYGGLVALEAAQLGLPIRRLVVYEPSIDDDPSFPAVVERIRALVDRGEIERAAETLLIERSGVPAEAIPAVREMPLWPIVLRGVEVLPREGAAVVGYRFDPGRFTGVEIPTLILVGEQSPGWRHEAMRGLQAALPQSQLHVLPGQGHLATHTAPDLLANEITQFLNA